MISNPLRPEEHNTSVNWPLVSLLDIVPTIMDWHKGVIYCHEEILALRLPTNFDKNCNIFITM